MISKQQFIQIIAVMTLAYPAYQLQPGTSEIYYRLLHDLPEEIISSAAQQIMAESKFFPSIAEWRTRALEIMNAKLNQPTAFEAWGIVQNEIQRVGSYGLPSFSNPEIERTVKAIGWRELCLSVDVMVLRAHFTKCYEQIVARKDEDQHLLPSVRKTTDEYRRLSDIEQLTKKLNSGEAKNA